MTDETTNFARLRAAFQAPAGPAPAPETCPAPETLWAGVRGELQPEQMREVLDHTAFCASCAEDWRLAAEIEREASRTATAAPGKVIVGRFGQWRPLAAAAAIAAGLLIAVGVYQSGVGPQESTYRNVEQTEVRSLLPEGQALSRQNSVLRWTPVPGATSYDVQVSTEDLQVVATAQGQTATEYRVPEGNLAGFAPGTKLLWQVDAVFPDGSRQSSPTFTTPLK
jgi:hypothetical protein